jgi:hypothetical protein
MDINTKDYNYDRILDVQVIRQTYGRSIVLNSSQEKLFTFRMFDDRNSIDMPVYFCV